ncbi:hypothetical protein ACIQCD_16330 [Streptomyces sp. NPDC093250]|uniref:hypothetical protein n=1 Tax=Streptomyces sp. NPDC093250 TaxID=3366036 RepID=UPI00381B717C
MPQADLTNVTPIREPLSITIGSAVCDDFQSDLEMPPRHAFGLGDAEGYLSIVVVPFAVIRLPSWATVPSVTAIG